MRKRIISSMLCLALVFVIGGGVFFSAFTLTAEAAESTIVHSDVLADLKKDSSFNEADYPANLSDHSMQVIQIAESDKKELFIYVYHPSNVDKDLKAKKINMALQEPADKKLHYDMYDLAFINANRVFSKYKVVGLEVSSEPERYYSIAGIYRDYDESLGDTLPEAVDTKQYKSYSVAQAWCCYYYNDKLVYEKENMNVLKLDILASGDVYYNKGFILYTNECDSHYIGFTPINYDIAKIYDADIEYTLHKVIATYTDDGSHSTYDVVDVIPKKDTLKNYTNDTSYGGVSGVGLLGKKYTWKRIQTSEEFINDIKAQSASGFDAVEESALKKAAFVFRFCETESKTKHALGSTSTTYYVVDSITIARMYFLTKDGKYFNLGVVHDLVGTDGMPDASITVGDNILNNLEDLTGKLDGWFEVIKIILLAILVIVFIGPITKVLSFVWDCIVNIVKIITKPIKNLFNRRRN